MLRHTSRNSAARKRGQNRCCLGRRLVRLLLLFLLFWVAKADSRQIAQR